jgi:SAM-dependent methyltransferase
MLQKLHRIYLNQRFIINFYSVFMNPFYFIRKDLYKNLKEMCPKLKGHLLDFGCGSKPYESLFSVEKYIGVDLEISGHQHLGEEFDKIDVFYDGKTIPFPDNHFDSVFSSEVFEHVFNLEDILDELNRVLKKQGEILITVPFVWEEHEVPYDFGRYSSFGIKHILNKKGFEIIEHRKSGHFIIVFFQMWNMYIYNLIKTNNKYINLFLNILFISPFTILGLIFSKIMPSNKNLFHNNIVLARKI